MFLSSIPEKRSGTNRPGRMLSSRCDREGDKMPMGFTDYLLAGYDPVRQVQDSPGLFAPAASALACILWHCDVEQF